MDSGPTGVADPGDFARIRIRFESPRSKISLKLNFSCNRLIEKSNIIKNFDLDTILKDKGRPRVHF